MILESARHILYLALVVGWNATHVVVNRWEDRDGFAGHIDAGEDPGRLGDSGQTDGQLLWREVVQLKVDMIFLGSAAAAFADLDGHGPGHDIAGGQIFGDRGVALHESLALGVDEVATLTSAAFGHETSSTIDTYKIRQQGIIKLS